jgi:hypothetical protein
LKRILVINQYATTPEFSTGAGERFYYLMEYFAASDMQTTIVSASFNHLFRNYPTFRGLYKLDKYPFGNFIWVKIRKYKKDNFFGRIFSWVEFLIKLFFLPVRRSLRPEVVIVSSMSLFPILYALYLKWRDGVYVILEIRDIWPLTPISLGGYSRFHPFIFTMSLIEKIGYYYSDEIVSVLPDFELHLESILGYKKKCYWIPNAISISAQENNISKLSEHRREFVIAYAGSLGNANAMEFVVKAAQHLKDIEDIFFHILGDGPEKDTLKDFCFRNEMRNVIFMDKVSKSDVQAFISKADVCIISWRKRDIYKFGVSANKYNDYMLAGKPIISASNIEKDPVIIANCGIQAEPENAHSVASAILEIRSLSLEQRSELGLNGSKFVLSQQIYDVISQQYVDLINNLNKHND